MGRGPTAYFIFAGEVRKALQAELEAEHGKVSVAVVGKAIGVMWHELEESERQRYKDLAAAKAAELKAEAEAERGNQQEEAAEGDAAEADHPADERPASLPASLVKKLMVMDPDVERVSGDAVRAMVKATEMFLGLLAKRALDKAREGKRKNFKFADIEAAARRDRRMQDMGLHDLLANDAAMAEVHEKEEGENQAKAGKKAAAEEQAKGSRPLTAFFATKE